MWRDNSRCTQRHCPDYEWRIWSVYFCVCSQAVMLRSGATFFLVTHDNQRGSEDTQTCAVKPVQTNKHQYQITPFPTFSAVVPHRSQCFHAILELCNFPYPARGGVFVHVWVCASVCRVIAAHWKPQRGQPQESLTVVSGSPLFCPPSFTSTTFP